MKNNERVITIVTVCDNHFAILLAALIKSIELNTKGYNVDLYIVEDKISEENKKKLIQSISTDRISVNWLEMDQVIPHDVKLPLDNSSFPLNVYIRLLIPYFIPQHLEKVLYLDVDMIVLKDLSELWNIDLEVKIVAGVVDRSELVSSSWGGITNYKELRLSPETKYFNSGLLVIKPKEWRERDIPNKVIKAVESNKVYANFPDQYGLNVVFANQWYELDSNWNCYSTSNALNPFIIHFTGRKPIYNSYKFNEEFKEKFYEYLELTQWKGYRPIGEWRRLRKKLYNKIVKIFKDLF